MKDEYIKKMDITQRVLAITGEWKDGPEFWIPIDPVLGNIALLPAEDVAPVRHGKWIYHMDDLYPEESTMECSVCGDFIFIRGESDNYCPNCGAKMDEEETKE